MMQGRGIELSAGWTRRMTHSPQAEINGDGLVTCRYMVHACVLFCGCSVEGLFIPSVVIRRVTIFVPVAVKIEELDRFLYFYWQLPAKRT